jgi:hypothetical protein
MKKARRDKKRPSGFAPGSGTNKKFRFVKKNVPNPSQQSSTRRWTMKPSQRKPSGNFQFRNAQQQAPKHNAPPRNVGGRRCFNCGQPGHYISVYLGILSPARAQPVPGPPTNHTRRVWAEILKPTNFFLARARPEMLFLVVLHYKMRGRPAQVQARPEPGPKIEARCVQWDGHGHDFLARNNKNFSARPEPSPARKMLRSTSVIVQNPGRSSPTHKINVQGTSMPLRLRSLWCKYAKAS